MTTKYNDPHTVKMVQNLAAQGQSLRAIAAKIGVHHTVIKKILDPKFVQKERARQAAVDAARKNDPARVAYMQNRNATDAHRAASRASMAKLRAKNNA